MSDDSRARRFALIGDPVAHSKSPAMHAAAYRALRLPHSYEAIRAAPADLAGLVGQLREGVYDGFNVTVPYKQRILEYVDGVDVSAAMAGAANTLVPHEDGTVIAYNTDILALSGELAQLAPDIQGEASGAVALVLGTGGAARSAIVALISELGVATVLVRGRSLATAAARDAFASMARPWVLSAGSSTRLVCAPLVASPEMEQKVTLVVQATSAGMQGASPGDEVARAVAWESLPVRAAALDVVYAPPDTPFLRRAAAQGIRSSNGLGMLVRQGALAFELWLGTPAPYNAMLASIL